MAIGVPESAVGLEAIPQEPAARPSEVGHLEPFFATRPDRRLTGTTPFVIAFTGRVATDLATVHFGGVQYRCWLSCRVRLVIA